MSLVHRPNHPDADEFGMVDKAIAGEPTPARSNLPFPMIISDQIELKSMVDGKIYTSKSALRRSYRAKGYDEVGNEWLRNEPKRVEPKIDRRAIRDTVGRAMTRAGYSF